MSGARYVGRVGGLAVALGAGVAILHGCAVATAAPAAADSSNQAHSTREAGGVGSSAAASRTSHKASRVAHRAATASPNARLTVQSNVTLTQDVITGNVTAVDAHGSPLTYTTVGAPSQGGDVLLNHTTGAFTYVPKAELLTSRGTEQFSVMVSETTPLDTALGRVPLVGGVILPLIAALHRTPVLGNALAPLIGSAVIEPITVDIAQVVPDGAPVARTLTVTSADGTKLNVHFYPAVGLTAGQTAPTVFNGAGLGFAGDTDPNSPWGTSPWNEFKGDAPLRAAGYNVVTWDPRGEFGSGGALNLDSAAAEGRDVSAIIDTIAQQPETMLDGTGDPRMGMIGGSLGGAIQLVTAATDHRIDAIVPAMTWHSLPNSLYQNGAFKTGWSALLLIDEVRIGAHVIPQLYEGLLTGVLTGRLTPAQQALLTSRNPAVSSITAPTMLLQAAGDSLFGLSEAQATAQTLAAGGVPVKMVWFCGGHGICLNPGDAGAALVQKDTLQWLDRYVKGNSSVSTGPVFEWLDQNGQAFSSDRLPSDPQFTGTPVVASGGGGILPIVPILGGSGPQPRDVLPYSLTEAAKARIALNLTVPGGPTTAQIVGAPQLTMTYSGIGFDRDVYAQLVDNKTGLVLSDLVTPVPVTLDGRTHTITVPLEGIAYTMTPDDSVTLQLVASATDYENFTAVGVIKVASMTIELPTVGAGADAVKEPVPTN
jgi:ABC-2 type transport system ATP-binding protein